MPTTEKDTEKKRAPRRLGIGLSRFKIHYSADGHKRGLPWLVHAKGETFQCVHLSIEGPSVFNSNPYAHPAGWIECDGYLSIIDMVARISAKKPSKGVK